MGSDKVWLGQVSAPRDGRGGILARLIAVATLIMALSLETQYFAALDGRTGRLISGHRLRGLSTPLGLP